MNAGASIDKHPLRRLATALADAGYSRPALRGAHVFPSITDDAYAAALERTAAPSRLNTLIRLFVIGAPVEARRAASAVSPSRLADLVDAGLVRRSGAMVRSIAAVTPMAGLWVVHDFPVRPRGAPSRPGCVLGPGRMSMTLTGLTVSRGGEMMLDLGAGQGLQSLVAGNDARHIVATDINPHAIRLARMGAAMNGVPVELREGSLFRPVRGMAGRFDLIVSNPPFVIAPPHDIVGVSGTVRGDMLCERIVRQAPEFLIEGGFATILLNWHHREDSDALPLSWAAGRGCDAWLVRLRTQDARDYAAQWIDELDEIGGAGSASPLNRWLRFYTRHGIHRISLGAIVLRRRHGRNWASHETAALDPPSPPAGTQIQRIFENRTFLESVRRSGQLLDTPLAPSQGVELVTRRRAGLAAWGTESVMLRQTSGLEFAMELDREVADVLGMLDRARTARAAIASMAPRGVRSLSSRCTPVLRRLLELGHLTIAARS